MTLAALHDANKAEWLRRINGATDVKAATDETVRWIDERIAQYARQSDARPASIALVAGASGPAAYLMGAVNQAQARVLPCARPAPAVGVRRALPYLPPALMFALAAWLFLGQMPYPSVFALIAGFCALLPALRAKPAAASLPDVQASPVADAVELTRRVERLFVELDRLFEADAPQPTGKAPSLSLLEAVQQMAEAQLTDDPAFALSALPRLLDALSRQGVVLRKYTGERAADFDCFPAKSGGETIRPAVYLGEQLILRGQATEKYS